MPGTSPSNRVVCGGVSLAVVPFPAPELEASPTTSSPPTTAFRLAQRDNGSVPLP